MIIYHEEVVTTLMNHDVRFLSMWAQVSRVYNGLSNDGYAHGFQRGKPYLYYSELISEILW